MSKIFPQEAKKIDDSLCGVNAQLTPAMIDLGWIVSLLGPIEEEVEDIGRFFGLPVQVNLSREE